MSYNGAQVEVSTTAAGHAVILQMTYGAGVERGVTVLIAAAGLSLLAILGLFTVLGVSTCIKPRSSSIHRFTSSHVAAYLISLLVCDLIATIGSLMNLQWIRMGGVHLGAFCTAQGATKNVGNVGTALWSLVIAVHTFCLLVLKWRSRGYALYITLFVVWSFVGTVVIIGVFVVQKLAVKGPYFGVSGYWCWITDGYATERLVLEYLWMFIAAFFSLLLYPWVILAVRGNIVKSGGKVRFRSRLSMSSWKSRMGQNTADARAMSLAKHMLPYPIAYTILILPIAVCRFLAWAGHEVPFEATIFADAMFLLSGLVNVILFIVTRKVIAGSDGLPPPRSTTATPDPEAQRAIYLASHVTPFMVPIIPDKPLPLAPDFASEPTTPAMRGPYPDTKILLERSIISRPEPIKHEGEKGADYPGYTDTPSPPIPVVRRPSAVTPLRVAKKPSMRQSRSRSGSGVARPKPAMLTHHVPASPPADPALRQSWPESVSHYSGSSYYSTTPLQDVLLPVSPRPPRSNQSSWSRRGELGSPHPF